jgi:hypothetical protein
MQQEHEGMRVEMNMKINEMIVAINKLISDHQTKAFVKNQPAFEQQVKTDEVLGTIITTSKDNERKNRTPKIRHLQAK